MVAGPAVNICNGCVDICLDIIRESTESEAQAPAGPYDADTPGLFCSVCTNRKPFSAGAQIPECGFVCFTCIAAVRAYPPPAPICSAGGNLTTRCSGLASLAAELDIVRRLMNPSRQPVISPQRSPFFRSPVPILCASLAGAFVLLFVLVYAYGYATVLFPAHVGEHRAFYRTCMGIRSGTTPAGVLSRMQGYVLAKRTGNRRVTPALAATHPHPTASASMPDTFLFYPNTVDTADWCVVEFVHDRVKGTWVSPD